ncbi:phage-related exonuclease [Agaricicola taiwanensis]|uniref:Phage-related exonuclease n=1 Tax=Agaricicola taiwanensis TaxID=591372 RepID=A0A8J2YGI4_9RHOB|nr:lambda exonuclease family protein [Agaricicola taiwanensis]GGE36124.1 phage-related exonuclease [Agaricicola taiwanensis]
MDQRTDEWDQARLGKVTASRVADVVARTKSGYSASRANYMAQLICERLTGVKAETFNSREMQWGTDTEAEARSAYCFYRDADIEEVGFVDHPRIAETGASPDGLVGDDGLVEIKCPNTSTHIETLLGQKVPEKYVTQMQWQMACTGRAWCDFVSYDPRMPADMRLFVQRVHRDEERIAELEREVTEFLSELDGKIAALRHAYAPPLMAAG